MIHLLDLLQMTSLPHIPCSLDNLAGLSFWPGGRRKKTWRHQRSSVGWKNQFPADSVPLGEGNHEISGQFGLRFDLQYAFIGVQKGETKGHGQWERTIHSSMFSVPQRKAKGFLGYSCPVVLTLEIGRVCGSRRLVKKKTDLRVSCFSYLVIGGWYGCLVNLPLFGTPLVCPLSATSCHGSTLFPYSLHLCRCFWVFLN